MKKPVYFVFAAVVFVLFVNCRSQKELMTEATDQDDAIQIAISDFSKMRRLYKKDSVFSVGMSVLTGKHKLLVVRVGKNNHKLLVTAETKIGVKGKLPSRFIEKENKLFFWFDDDYPLTAEAMAVFQRYNLLQDDENGLVTFPDSVLDDAEKAAHYYFCKDNLAMYKRVVTNIGVGYYDPPKLECGDGGFLN